MKNGTNELLFVTGNENKLKEAKIYLKGYNINKYNYEKYICNKSVI